jgi:hypothetical protein
MTGETDPTVADRPDSGVNMTEHDAGASTAADRDLMDRDLMDRELADRDPADRNLSLDEEGLVAPNSTGSVDPERPAIVVASVYESEAPVGPASELSTAPAQAVTSTEPDGNEERWHSMVADFIDDPRGSVVGAAELVKTELTALIAQLSRRQEALGERWQTTESASDSSTATEDLRLAFRDYRDFSRQIAAGRKVLS